jgi:hypothetical protein
VVEAHWPPRAEPAGVRMAAQVVGAGGSDPRPSGVDTVRCFGASSCSTNL